MRRNPSFVFFRIADELSLADGPIGGAGVPLTPHRSLAVDRMRWAYGLPFWLDGQLPTARRGETTPLARLMIAADTGSAIVGPARFDYFFGAGPEAGLVAGLTRHGVSASVLWPRAAPRSP
jgi:membrane-bound lytic murein transglycosylase A